MSRLPPCIVFCNGDITYNAAPPPNLPNLDVFIGAQPNNPHSYITSKSELNTIQTQLFIDDTMTKDEFDARMAVDPNYSLIVRLQGMRILVILPTFHDILHRHHADVIMFLHQGLADIETNWFGECRQSIEMQRFTIYDVLRASHDRNVINLPEEFDRYDGYDGYKKHRENRCNECGYPFWSDMTHTFSGIKISDECKCGCGVLTDNQGRKISPIYLPNKDRESNNHAFIHRK